MSVMRRDACKNKSKKKKSCSEDQKRDSKE